MIMPASRIKIHETRRVSFTVVTGTPTVFLVGPAGTSDTSGALTPHREPTVALVAGGAHDNTATSTTFAWAASFTPTAIGTWTVIVQDASSGIQRFVFNCQLTSEAEERLGLSRIPRELTEIGGLSIAGTELAGHCGVCVTPEWMASLASQVAFSYMSVSVDTSFHIYANSVNTNRIPYDGLLTGIRFRAGATDMSTRNEITDFYVAAFHGAVGVAELRSISENVSYTRLVKTGSHYYILFEKPLPVRTNDYIAIIMAKSGGANISVMPVYVGAAKTVVTKQTDGVITNSGGVYELTSAVDFDAAGVVGSDDDLTHPNYVRIMEDIGGSYTDYGAHKIVRIKAGDVNTLVLAEAGTLTHTGVYDFCVTSAPTDAPGKGAQWKIIGAGSFPGLATSPTDIRAPAAQEAYDACVHPFNYTMNPPVVAFGGDSVMAGSDLDSSPNTVGTLHDYHLPSRVYSPEVDIAWLVSKMLGAPCVNASRGGSSLKQWIAGTTAFSYASGGTQQFQAALTYRPGVLVHSCMTNDCVSETFDDKNTYLKYMDKLLQDCIANDVMLIVTTGIPVQDRTAAQQARATLLRQWLFEWAALNSVRAIDTAELLQPYWKDGEALFSSGDAIGSYAFPDHDSGGEGYDVHLKPAGTRALARLLGTDLLRSMMVYSPKTAALASKPVEVSSLTEAALAMFANTDSGETEPVAGSVCKLSRADSPTFILAAQALLSTSQVVEQAVKLVQYSTGPKLVWYVVDADGNPVNVEESYEDIRLDVFDGRTSEIAFTLSLANGITIEGAGKDQIWVDRQVEHVSEVVASKYVLWGIAEPTAEDVPLRTGAWEVVAAAKSGAPVPTSAAFSESTGPIFVVAVQFNGPLERAELDPANWRASIGEPTERITYTGPIAVAIDGSRVILVLNTVSAPLPEGSSDYVEYLGSDLQGVNGDAVDAFTLPIVAVT